MTSSAPQRSYGHRGSLRNQRRFVPKISAAASSSSSTPVAAAASLYSSTPVAAATSSSSSTPAAAAAAAASSSSSPTLTTALRESSPSRSRSKSTVNLAAESSGSFVNYLPQDEAVAAGLGADAGGLDVEESQAVVDHLNDELSRILKLSPRDFWREVAKNDSLHQFLDSYLQFRNRWYDFAHHGSTGTVAGVIVGEFDLCRRVFMVFYRISSNKDPTVSASDSLSMREHTALLQEKKLLDLPKLLDICAIFGHENIELTRLLVTNAIKAQPRLNENINVAVSHFLSLVHTMHQRCSSSLEVLISSGGHEDRGQVQLYKDFLEVMDFINDSIVTLDAFADAYKPAAMYFSLSFELSYGHEELLSTLARLHDFLLPSLHQGLARVPNIREDGSESGGLLPNIITSLKILSTRIVKFGWKLLDLCYLSDEPIEDSLLQSATKMFPANVEDPAIRGDILIQTLREINSEVAYHLQENHNSGTFIQNIEKKYKILSRMSSLRSKGWMFMDEDQFQFLTQIATPLDSRHRGLPASLLKDKAHIDEDAAIIESKISQIKDLFPDYGKGFLSACLEVYNQNPEEVIQRILDGTLHQDLSSLDTTLDRILPPQSASLRIDKGKGILLEPESPFEVAHSIRNWDSSSVSSTTSSFGRYTRKSKDDDLPDSNFLDSTTAKEAIRSAVLAVENEYEDEYDDSFDELGLSVVESGFGEAESLTDQIGFPGKSSVPESEGSSRWGSKKKPQFYVKDGKNYSYKVSGSIGVSNAREAAVLNLAQKDMVHGLGRGGNIPLGAAKMLGEDTQISDEGVNGGPNSRGRGGRRGGGGNNYRKDRAMKKHFAGLGGF